MSLVLEFASCVVKNLPSRMSADIMQNWIGNPKALQKVLAEVLLPPQSSVPVSSNIIQIDRSVPFNPTRFKRLGKGWTIWKGPPHGDGLRGPEDQDERSLSLKQVDFNEVKLETMLRKDQKTIKGEEKLLRLSETSRIRLDANIFEEFWLNDLLIRGLLTKEKKDEEGHLHIFFDGTVFRSPVGERWVLGLEYTLGRWDACGKKLSDNFYDTDPSAVLDL